MKNEEGNTPLHYACIRGNLEVVKLLNSKGAQMSERNTAFLKMRTPLEHQAHFGQTAVGFDANHNKGRGDDNHWPGPPPPPGGK